MTFGISHGRRRGVLHTCFQHMLLKAKRQIPWYSKQRKTDVLLHGRRSVLDTCFQRVFVNTKRQIPKHPKKNQTPYYSDITTGILHFRKEHTCASTVESFPNDHPVHASSSERRLGPKSSFPFACFKVVFTKKLSLLSSMLWKYIIAKKEHKI
jgi:hypothetical protein